MSFFIYSLIATKLHNGKHKNILIHMYVVSDSKKCNELISIKFLPQAFVFL